MSDDGVTLTLTRCDVDYEISVSDNMLGYSIDCTRLWNRKCKELAEGHLNIKDKADDEVSDFKDINGFEFVITEYDDNFKGTKITDRNEFSNHETQILNLSEEFVNKYPQLIIPNEKSEITCAYNRNAKSFALSFQIDNLGMSVDKFVWSDK